MSLQFQVRDPLGNTIDGCLEARDADEARQMLERDGFEVLEIEDNSDGFELFAKRIKSHDIIYTTSQLSIMVETGINLSAALNGLAEQEENPTLRKLLFELKSNVESGEDFSAALARHPKHFDKTFVALVRASEQTGSLGTMLDRISNYVRSELETRSKVRAALAYPGIMMALAIGVTVFLLTYVMPKFTPLFERKGIELPTPTRFIMAISQTLTDHWLLWAVGLLVGGIGLMFGLRSRIGMQTVDWLRINLPIVGPLYRKVIISRSIRTLGTMIQSGVSMLDAIRLTSEVAGNHYYVQLWDHVLQQITQGSRICDALKGNPLMPRTLIQMIGSGEDTGKLDYVLDKVSVYYDREVETSLKTATSLIEPIMITAMGVVIGTIGLSILLPIFSLSRAGG